MYESTLYRSHIIADFGFYLQSYHVGLTAKLCLLDYISSPQKTTQTAKPFGLDMLLGVPATKGYVDAILHNKPPAYINNEPIHAIHEILKHLPTFFGPNFVRVGELHVEMHEQSRNKL